MCATAGQPDTSCACSLRKNGAGLAKLLGAPWHAVLSPLPAGAADVHALPAWQGLQCGPDGPPICPQAALAQLQHRPLTLLWQVAPAQLQRQPLTQLRPAGRWRWRSCSTSCRG